VADGVPTVWVKALSELTLVVMVGVATLLAVPLTATFLVVAPVLVLVTLRCQCRRWPVVAHVDVVVATVPPDWVRVSVVPKPLLLLVETWKLVGAVTTRLAVRLLPETV